MVASLLAAGMPLAPVMVLLVSSPLVSPASFVIAWGALGPAIALTKLVSAVTIGLAAGLVTHYLVRTKVLAGQIRPSVLGSRGATGAPQASPACGAASAVGCAKAGATRPGGAALMLDLGVRYWRMSFFIGRFVLIGLVAQTLLVHYLPRGWIESTLGVQNQLSVVLAALVGLPAYVNGMAAIPLLGGLLEIGMDPGAAVAFLIAGPVATVPSIIAVTALVRRRALAVYVGSGLVGAIAFGYLFDLVYVLSALW